MEKQLKHIAFIMDGNGRWATSHNLPRHLGHKKGCEVVAEVYEGCLEKGIEALSVFAFSTENWNRPKEEINYLFQYLEEFFKKEIDKFIQDGCSIIVSGDLSKIPEKTRKVIESAVKRTENNNKIIFNICLNYGGKAEIVEASRLIAKDVKDGKISLDSINEQSFENYLFAKNLPPVDLLIRTSGEMRISNFMLWQIAYAEMIFTKTYWPDFNKKELFECIDEFYSRNRTYGGIKNGH